MAQQIPGNSDSEKKKGSKFTFRQWNPFKENVPVGTNNDPDIKVRSCSLFSCCPFSSQIDKLF
jgi:hypothetical protein